VSFISKVKNVTFGLKMELYVCKKLRIMKKKRVIYDIEQVYAE
jgi:hypothetical protein